MQQFPNSPSLFYTYTFLLNGNSSNSGKFCLTDLISHSPHLQFIFHNLDVIPPGKPSHTLLNQARVPCSALLHTYKLWQARILRISSPPASAPTVAGTQDCLLNC